MPQKWSELSSSEGFKALPADQQEKTRVDFFNNTVAPTLAPGRLDSARKYFDEKTLPKPAAPAANVANQDSNVTSPTALVRPNGGPGFTEGVKDIGRGIARGFTEDLPAAAGALADFVDTPKHDAAGKQLSDDGALSKWGRGVQEAAAKRGENWQQSEYGRQMQERDALSVRGGAFEGGKGLPLSFGPMLAGAATGFAVGRLPGAVVGAIGGSIAALPLFFGSQAKDTYDRVYAETRANNPDLTDEQVHEESMKAGELTGGVEAGGELLADLVGAKLFKAIPSGIKKGLVKEATKGFQGAVPLVKGLAKLFGTEVGTELGQGAAQAEIEKSFGVGEGATWDNQKGVIVPTVIMTLIGGGAAAGMSASQRYRTAKLLQNTNLPAEQRLEAAKGVAQVVAEQDPELADMFYQSAAEQIAGGRPVIARDDRFYRDFKPLDQREIDKRMAEGDFSDPEKPFNPLDEVGKTIDTITPDQQFTRDRQMDAEQAAPQPGDEFQPVDQPGETIITPPPADVSAANQPVTSENTPSEAAPEAAAPRQAAAEAAGAPQPRSQGMSRPMRQAHMADLDAQLKVVRAERKAAEQAGDESTVTELDGEIRAIAANFKRIANGQSPEKTPRQAKQPPETGGWSGQEAAPEAPKTVLQNRNRATPASIEQMTSIAANPDYTRLGFSRDFANGAPVVEPGADIPDQNLGRQDVATTAAGRQIPVQYAVVEADQLLPSNRADGSPVAEYEQGAPGMSRAIAGNGRLAGLQRAYGQGTATQYVDGVAGDAALHGIPEASVRAMTNPVLVRIMPQEEVTDNIGDESNTSGTAELSPAEQARNDTRRIDIGAVELDDNGDPTKTAVDQFIASMPTAERAGLLDGKIPNRKAYERLGNAVFAQAYESDELLRLAAEATDGEIRNVLGGLKHAAGKMSRLKGAGKYDVRPLIVEAAEAAVNAKRNGQTLKDYLEQGDMGRNPAIVPILEMMAANSRSPKKIGEALSNLADTFNNEASLPESDMFGTVEKRSPQQLLDETYGTETATAAQDRPGNQEGTGNAGRPDTATRSDDRKTVAPVAGSPAEDQAVPAEEVAPTEGYTLSQETESERVEREKLEQEKAETAKKAEQEAEAKAKKEKEQRDTKSAVDSSVHRFELGQDVDQQLSGQTNLLDVPEKPKSQQKLDDLDAQIEAAAAELAELLKPKPGTLNTGVDPQILLAGTKLGSLYIQKGLVKFAQWAQAIIAKMREMGVEADQIKPHLKEIYAATQQRATDEQFNQMDDARTVRGFDIDGLESGAQAEHPIAKLKAEREEANKRQEAAFARAGNIGAAAQDAIDKYENGDIEIEEFEALLSAAEVKSTKNKPVVKAAKPEPSAELPPILAKTKKAYLSGMALKAGLKKSSPGYQNALDRLEDQYEEERSRAEAELTFGAYNALNKDTPEPVNRLAYNALREEFGLDSTESKPNQETGGPRQGTIGMKLEPGEVVLTASGRKTTPFPKIDTSTNIKAGNTIKRVDTWLMENALNEALARNDKFNAPQFQSNMEKPSPADKDSAEEYLFGEQPAVLPSIIKPLSAPTESKPDQERDKINSSANEAAASPTNDLPSPTPAQIEADNYKKGEPFTLHGQKIVIENPRGSMRGDKETGGKKWQNKMAAHYGDIKGTVAADGDNLDVFVGQNPESERIFIIDQQKKNGDKGGFDEHKVMIGFSDQAAAEKAYLGSYMKGWGLGPVTELSIDQFKTWLASADTSKPVAPQARELRGAAQSKPAANTSEPTLKEGAGFNKGKFKYYTPSATDSPPGPFLDSKEAARAQYDKWQESMAAQRVEIEAQESIKDRIRGGDTNAIPALEDFDRKTGIKELSVLLKNIFGGSAAAGERFIKKHGSVHGVSGGGYTLFDTVETINRAQKYWLTNSHLDPEKAYEPNVLEQSKQEVEKPAQQTLANTDDVGGEMIANRRTFSGITLKELDEADNEALQVQMAQKTRVWNRPDYEALVADGMQAPIAHLMKQVYDSISNKPAQKGEKYRRAYVETVLAVREAAEAFVNDRQTIIDLIRAVVGTGRTEAKAGHTITTITSMLGSTEDRQAMARAASFILDRAFPKNNNGNRWGSGNPDGNTRVLSIGGNKFVQAATMDRNSLMKAMKAVGEGWPAKQEMWQRRFNIVEKDGIFQIKKKSAYRPVATAETYEAAVEKARELASPASGEAAFEEPKVELKNIKREGVDYRQGRNVSTQDLQDTFGFSKINFGDWLKGDSNAAERQAHVNHIHDAMMDLADTLGLPPKAMSLNGMLSVAVGAQGRGGSAAAHFVPGVNEINITRYSGAGSLAHEWGHAMDHYFGVMAGLSGQDDPFLSEFADRGYMLKDSTVRKEVVEAYQYLLNNMEWVERIRSPEEMEALREKQLASGRKSLDRRLGEWRASVEKDGGAKNLAAFDALAAKLTNGERGEMVALGKSRGRMVGKNINKMRDLLKLARGYLPSLDDTQWLDSSVGAIANSIDAAEFAKAHEPQVKERSQFKKNASAKDKNPQKPYWNTRLEMFARAFEMYALDAYKQRSDYMTASWKAEEGDGYLAVEAADRYPRGTEREAINDAFSKLFEVIESRETDDGVVLFRKDDAGSVVAGLRVTRKDADKVVARILAGWKDGLARNDEITIVDTFDQLPEAVKQRARDQGVEDKVVAVFHNGKVHINLSKIQDERRLESAIFHETYGHYGLRKLFGKELPAKLSQLYMALGGDKGLREIAARHDKAKILDMYIRDFDKQVAGGKLSQENRDRFLVDELLAFLQEDNRPTVARLAREILGMIRQAFRRLGYFALEQLSDNEVFALLRQSRLAVQKNEDGKGGGTMFMVAYHGSPHLFTKFSTDKIGSGEGNQAYGWGIYTAQQKSVAETYRSGVTLKKVKNEFLHQIPQDISIDEFDDLLSTGELALSPQYTKVIDALRNDDWLGFDYPSQAIQAAFSDLDLYDPSPELREAVESSGQLYTVEVPENDELLDWDAPLREQPEKIQNILHENWLAHPDAHANQTGEEIYREIANDVHRQVYDNRSGPIWDMVKDDPRRLQMRPDEIASRYLSSLGIPGHRYLDEFSRNKSPDVPAFDSWAGYFKGADMATASDAYKRELRAEYQEFVDQEDTRTRNFVIFDDDRIEITDTLFRVAENQDHDQTQDPEEVTRRPLRATLRDRLDAVRFEIQDKLIDLKRIQEEADPADDANAYQKAAIWEGKAGERISDFDEGRVQPLLTAIARTGMEWDEVGKWLVARHAREANAYLSEINLSVSQKAAQIAAVEARRAELNSQLAQAREANPHYGNQQSYRDMVRVRDSLAGVMAAIQNRDAMPDDEHARLSGMSNEEAAEILERHSNNASVWEVGDMVDRINRERVDMLIEEGLITRDMAGAWQGRYQHYVPLKREEAEGSDHLPGRGQGFNIKGKESKMRVGSAHWTPGKIVANVLAQYESSIVRAEKNKVGQALLKFVEQHPDESFWNIDTERTEKYVRNGQVVEGPKGQDAVHELSVKRDGVQHYISFNTGNPRAMRLVTGLKNLQAAEMGAAMRAMATVTRFLATINTSWNPEFMVSNFARDIQTAAYNLSNTDVATMRGQVIKDVPAAMNGIRSALFGDGSSEWAPIWDDFRKNGGKTGWMDIHGDVLKKENDLKKMAERIAHGKPSRGKIERFVKGVEGANNIIENGIRLAAYKAGLDAGLSKDRAAAMAKDLTVNFNRKGNRGAQINALYMFFNAAVQGNVRLIQAIAGSKQGRNMAMATIGFAIVLDMINRSLSGDDDDGQNIYDTLPDYLKDRNIIFMNETGVAFKIPAPWGYNVLHTIGQVIGQAMTGEQFSPLDGGARVAMSIVDAFNPMGSGTLAQVLSPTVTDPIVQISENKNFAGRPLKPEHTFDSRVPKPEYQMHWSTAREASQAIAKFLNDASGGNEIRPGAINLSPEWIDLIVDTVTGGLGMTAANTLDTATRLVTGKEIPAENIPFVRKVTGYNNENGVKGRYYEWSKGVAYAKSEAKGLRGEELAEARKNPEYQLIGQYTAAEKQLTVMRKMRRQMEERGASEENIDKLDDRIRAVMARFNEAYAQKVLK